MNKLNFKINLKQITFITLAIITSILLISYVTYTINHTISNFNTLPLLPISDSDKVIAYNILKQGAISTAIFFVLLIIFYALSLFFGCSLFICARKNKTPINSNLKIILTSILIFISTLLTLHYISNFTIDLVVPNFSKAYLKIFIPETLILILLYLELVYTCILFIISTKKISKQSTIITPLDN